MRVAVPGDDPSGLPGAEDQGVTAEGREDRRRLEVVVADVVRCHLVVPEELSRGTGEDDERVGVERRAAEPGSVRKRFRPAPRAGVRDAGVHVAARVDADGIPGAASSGLRVRPRLLDRRESPDDPSRRGRERVHGTSPAGWEALGAHIDAAVVDDRCDRDELLEPVHEAPRPQRSSRFSVEREDRGVGGADHSRARDGEAVRAVVRRSERVLPAKRACLEVERVHARPRVLYVHGLPRDDRIGGDRAE